MAFRAIFFFFSLFLAVTMAPQVQGQLGLGGLLGLTRITGIIYCTPNGNANGTATPVFPNALVQLQCGRTGTVVSSATTDASGLFTILVNQITMLLSTLLSNCSLVVPTPLTTCNASLPVGGVLTSVLAVVGGTVGGVLRVLNLSPAGFSFVPLN